MALQRDRMFNGEDAFVPVDDPNAGLRAWIPKTRLPKVACIPQLRLFTTELAFLTLAISRCKFEESIIIYAGAASGNHIPALASLFPKTHFFLYDPLRFDIKGTSQIHIFRKLFTDAIAHEWRQWSDTHKRKIIFISDIRTPNLSGANYEKEIGVNMATQSRWVEILQCWSSLKFRIPYDIVDRGDLFPYLGGWLMLQPFTKGLSMEMRLVCREEDAKAGSQAVLYDTHRLEQLMFHHNTVIRPNKNLFCNVFSLDAKQYTEPGFNHGYDVTYLLYVIDNYRMSRDSAHFAMTVGEEPNIEFVKRIVDLISGKRWNLITHTREMQK